MTELDMNNPREAAARLAGGANLKDIRILNSSFSLEGFPDDSRALSYAVDVEPSGEYEPGSPTLMVASHFQVKVRQKSLDEDGSANEIAVIEFVVAGLFKVDTEKEYKEIEVDSFISTTGLFSLFPYAREYVQNTTSRMGLPQLTLDLMKLNV